VPATGERALDRWKERALFALVLALVGVEAVGWTLGILAGGAAPGQDPGGQRYVSASGPRGPLPATDAVFAAEEPTAYFDEALPMRWVAPKALASKKEPVKLELPKPSFPAPPLVLPVPGPAVESSSGLPRWPGFPPPPAKGK